MIGWVSQWTALVLLLLCAATTAIDDLTIVKMEWSYDGEADSTTLTVCTVQELESDSYTLEITPSKNSNEYDWTFVGKNITCANFNNGQDGGKLPPPAEQTTYKLSSDDGGLITHTGTVSFVLEGTAIACGESQFLRFELTTGTVDATCIEDTETLDPSVCYIAEEGSTADQVCFSNLDSENDQLHVCVQNVAFEPAVPDAGVFTGEELNYPEKKFGFTFENQDLSLKEMLILSDGISPTVVVSCEADNTCVDDSFTQSTAYYDLCGVFLETGGAVNSGKANFQDMDLRVDTVTPTIDFHFIKVTENNLYSVSGLDEYYEPIGIDFTLDCSHITQGTICNGFFNENENLKNIAVSYTDGTNKIIASVSAS